MMTKAKPCHVGNQLTINRNCTGGGIKRLTSLFKLFSALILCATLFNPIVSLAQSGSGTESDPYIISSINDWNFFATKVKNGESPYSSASYKVTADINCSLIYEWGQLHWPGWNSEGNGLYQFGTESNLFTGTFDFDGHTFDTIAIADAQQGTKVGLFHIGVGGVVKNLTFSGYVYLNEGNNIDIGVVAGTNQGTIENCKISDVDISNWGSNYAAGICVLNAASGTVKNCTVENSKIGKTQTTATVGGICAVNAGTIDGCEVSNLTLNAKEGQDQGNVGGICGVSSNKIVDCDASSIDIKSGGNAGGICGMMSGTLSGIEVKDLAYTSNSACNFGGICGHMNENSTISQCVLSGSSTKLKSEGNVGGIVGKAEMGNSKIDQCAVSGESIEINGKNSVMVGGVVGNINSSTSDGTISNCYVNNASVLTENGGNDVHVYAIAAGNGTSNVSVSDVFFYCDQPETKGVDAAHYVGGTPKSMDEVYYATSTTTEGTSGNVSVVDSATLRQLLVNLGDYFVESSDGGMPKLSFEEGGATKGASYLLVDGWNFVASLTEQDVKVLGDNQRGLITKKEHDITAMSFNYGQTAVANGNQWLPDNDEYMKDGDKMEVGKGYFVYVWPNAKLDDYEEADENAAGEILDESSYKDGNLVYWTQDKTASNKTLTLTHADGVATQSGAYWFALGNTSAGDLSVASFLSSNSDVNGLGVYVWTPKADANGGSWGPTMSTGSVGYAKGFMVGSDSKQSITFTINGNSSKKSMIDYVQLQHMQFAASANQTVRNAYALLMPQSDNGFDQNDMFVLLNADENYVEPYFAVEDKHLVENVFASLPYTSAINFHAMKQSDVKFSVSNVPNDIAVYMVDLTTGQQTLISDGSAFEFTAQEGENEGRYAVKFVSLKSAITETTEANVNIWNADRNINISGEQIKNVEVLNVLGQSVYNQNVNATEHHFDLNAQSGTYIIKVATAKGEKVQKITLK